MIVRYPCKRRIVPHLFLVAGALCEDRIGTGPPRSRTKVVYVKLGYWACSGSIHPKGDPVLWRINSSVFRPSSLCHTINGCFLAGPAATSQFPRSFNMYVTNMALQWECRTCAGKSYLPVILVLHTWCDVYRDTSLLGRRPSPWDPIGP